jgi:DNA-binding NarL/FixJ family response regulator
MNILIVDDHPMTTDLYENILLNTELGSPVFVTKALNCEDAYEAFTNAKIKGFDFDLALIDYSLPIYKAKNISSGGDIASLIKRDSNCKIIIITAQTQVLLVYDILKKIKPDGMVIKSDVTNENFMNIIKTVLEGNLYQSPLVKTYIKEIWKKEIMADETNRQIILFLSKGYKIKELKNVISLTESAIQKRICKLKKTFNVDDDRELVRIAFDFGYL